MCFISLHILAGGYYVSSGVQIETPDYAKCSASSVFNNDAYGHLHGKGRLDSGQGWSALYNAADQWWEMDLGSTKRVAGVVTQGRIDNNQYVKSYKVRVSIVKPDWTDVDSGKEFPANTAANNAKKQNKFESPVEAQYVRVMVQTWENHVSMRAGVLIYAGAPLVHGCWLMMPSIDWSIDSFSFRVCGKWHIVYG